MLYALLALANDQDVMASWAGLGYYARARNLLKCARTVVREYDGKFPTCYNQLIKLPGIGPYTASAILSIAFSKSYAVLDGNVSRVLSRYFAIDTPIDSSDGKKIFKELSQKLMNIEDPAIHNQAIMEFGALMCTPKCLQELLLLCYLQGLLILVLLLQDLILLFLLQ